MPKANVPPRVQKLVLDPTSRAKGMLCIQKKRMGSIHHYSYGQLSVFYSSEIRMFSNLDRTGPVGRIRRAEKTENRKTEFMTEGPNK